MRIAPTLLLVLQLGCARRAERGQGSATSGSTPIAPAEMDSTSPCGDLPCREYDSPRDAFLAAIAEHPAVIAIGEAHAQKGAVVPSAAKRFTDDILPALGGRASDLLVELIMPPRGCAKAAEEVRKKQEPVTSRQAETDQSEYVVMGDRARSMAIIPDLLRPSCEDMDAVRDAGQQAVDASLRLIARLCDTQAEHLVDRDARSDADTGKAVVIYGGMLHNDLSPPPDRAAYAYAPALDRYVGGRLVSVDLVVPEFIADDEAWRSLPWVAHYDRARLGSRTTLITTGARSYVLVFAESAK